MDANEFARRHPELFEALDSIEHPMRRMTAQDVATERRQGRREAVWGTAGCLAVFLLLLAGYGWWEWGGWALVLLGAVGAVLAGSLVELVLHLTGRVYVIDPYNGEVHD